MAKGVGSFYAVRGSGSDVTRAVPDEIDNYEGDTVSGQATCEVSRHKCAV